MLLPFEFTKIKFIVDSTNDLLTFETDSSISEKFKKCLQQEIEMLEDNRFDLYPFETSYEELNIIIDYCIEALRERINLVDCGKISTKLIQFDEKKYEKLVWQKGFIYY